MADLPPTTDAMIRRIAAGFASSNIGICLFTPEDTLAYASPSFVALWDLQAGARTFSDIMRHCHAAGTGPIIETDDIEGWLAKAATKRRQTPERSFEVDMQDGRWFWATESIFDDGWLLFTISDITRLKANERTLRQARDAAMYWAETDTLTGLYNRRFVMRRLNELAQEATVSSAALSVALIDIDHFKRINDAHGHDVGDQVLQHFAATGGNVVRRSDILARVGGEEFLLVMPDAAAGDAYRVVDRLREQVAQAWPVGAGVLRYTISAGVVQFNCNENAGQLYKRVDLALYRAKQTGRNRVEADFAA